MTRTARHPSVLSAELVGHYRRLDTVRRKLEKLFHERVVTRYDIEIAYSGLYLNAVVSLERFIEALFIGVLAGRFRGQGTVAARVHFKSDLVARDVVLGGRPYVDWLPYEQNTLRRAKAFFRGGQPFSGLDRAEKKLLEQAGYIRNALAHKSAHSLRMFEREVVGNLPLIGHERTPAGFLRSLLRQSPSETRYENIVTELAAISQKLGR